MAFSPPEVGNPRPFSMDQMANKKYTKTKTWAFIFKNNCYPEDVQKLATELKAKISWLSNAIELCIPK